MKASQQNQASGYVMRAIIGIVWNEGPVTAQQVHAKLTARPTTLATVRMYLAELAKEGRIERVARNLYGGTEGGGGQ